MVSPDTDPTPDSVSNAAPAPLHGESLVLRLAAIGFVIAGIVGLFLSVGGWLTPQKLSPAKVVDRFEQVSGGVHSGFRRNHAKGVCVTGYFESNGNGVALSKAVVFASGRVPVVGRIAFAGGMPYVGDAPGMVRSLAVLFKLPDGEEWRSGMVNLPVFPVNSVEGLYDLLLASAPDPTTHKPDPAKMSAFFAKHPEATKSLPLIGGQRLSSGFANTTYECLNAFHFVNAEGAVATVRWAMVPVQPFEPVDAAAPTSSNTNAMFDALIAAIHAHPLQWHLVITIAHPDDSTAASVLWPPDRQQVDVGTLTIDNIESEDTSPTRDINFDPLVLPNGIAPSDDPILSARSAAYSVSFTRREGETKQPSAVTTAETQK